jgi:nitrate/TMAO reductase-like tetraheme cytochrome c subunit
MSSQQRTPSQDGTRRRSWGAIRWLLVWGTISGLGGVALVALTNQAVVWSSSNVFCGTFCHSMTWASAAYQQGPHYINTAGVHATCGQCHIPYDSGHATATEYVALLLFKADRGARDFWNEWRKTIATKEEWETRRPQLRAEFEGYLRAHNYITCLGCHALGSFGGPRSEMKVLIHKDVIEANDVDCLRCHRNIGHVYERPAGKAHGWYTVEQAAAGQKLYQAQCARCHGARLEGGVGPSLSGASWRQMYGGSTLLPVWGEIKGPMAQYAGVPYTTQQSLDILSYLLQQNGLPAGSRPLSDTRELSDILPAK